MLSLLFWVAQIIAVLIYIFGSWNKHLLPESTILWPYLLVGVYLILVYFNYSVQHTTYSLLRNYLVDRDGLEYNSKEVFVLQNLVNPNFFYLALYMQYLIGIIVFISVLFLLGWGLAIAIPILTFLITAIFPVNYPYFMKIVRNNYKRHSQELFLQFAAQNFSMSDFEDMLNNFIDNKSNIHKLYLQKITEKTNVRVQVDKMTEKK